MTIAKRLLLIAPLMVFFVTFTNEWNVSGLLHQLAILPTLHRDSGAPFGHYMRFRTVDVPPTYLTCTNFQYADDATDVQLTVEGRAKFADPDAVQSALSSAVADTISQFIVNTNNTDGVTLCDGMCAGVYNTGYGTGDDISVVSSLNWGWNVHINEPECSAEGSLESPFFKSWNISITGPEKAEVDLYSIVSAMNFSAPGALPAGIDPSSIAYYEMLFDALLALGSLPATEISPGMWQFVDTTSGADVTLNMDDKVIQLFGTGFVAAFASSSGSLASGGTFTLSGKTVEILYVVEEGTGMEYYAETNILADPVSVSHSGGPVTINAEISFNQDEVSETVSRMEWEVASCMFTKTTSGPMGPIESTTAIDGLSASGAVVETITDESVKIDPGFRSKCRYDFCYVPAKEFDPLACSSEFQLWLDAPTGYKAPLGKAPMCRIYLSPRIVDGPANWRPRL